MRRALLLLLALCAAALLPWTAYLGHTLPTTHRADGWRAAWVGFDLGLLVLLGCAAWLGTRRHPLASGVMTATAALLLCDAWFDITLDWGSSAVWASIACAALVEVPLAALLLRSSRQLLSGGMARHVLTADDVRLGHETDTSTVLAVLAEAPAPVATIAARSGLSAGQVNATLQALLRGRQVRRGRAGRWSTVPVSLERPALASLSGADRSAVEAFYAGKLQQELRLFEWAAARHTAFDVWAKGSRAGMWLTERELRRFDREYLGLVLRYSMLHAKPTADTRELAVRWYAFPTREEHERTVGAAGAS